MPIPSPGMAGQKRTPSTFSTKKPTCLSPSFLRNGLPASESGSRTCWWKTTWASSFSRPSKLRRTSSLWWQAAPAPTPPSVPPGALRHAVLLGVCAASSSTLTQPSHPGRGRAHPPSLGGRELDAVLSLPKGGGGTIAVFHPSVAPQKSMRNCLAMGDASSLRRPFSRFGDVLLNSLGTPG